jgi:hypothetical protein
MVCNLSPYLHDITCVSRSRSQSVSPASRTESCPQSQSQSLALYPPANGVGVDAARSIVTGTGALRLLPTVSWSVTHSDSLSICVTGGRGKEEMTVKTMQRRIGAETGDATDNADDTSHSSNESEMERSRGARVREADCGGPGGQGRAVSPPQGSRVVGRASNSRGVISSAQSHVLAGTVSALSASTAKRDRELFNKDKYATASIASNYCSSFLLPLPTTRTQAQAQAAHHKSKSVDSHTYSLRPTSPQAQNPSVASPKLTLDTSCMAPAARPPQLTPRRKQSPV